MKFPLVTSFCIASAIFIASAYVADRVAFRISYRHGESAPLNSLGKQDEQELQTTLRTLSFLSETRIVTKYEPSTANYHTALERAVPALEQLRSQAPERLRPIIDLQLATDYAAIARLEQGAEASRAMELAQGLLNSLGWKDVSADALNRLAEHEVQPLRISEDKK
ncbi:MAG: hypothetical protein WAK89_03855 [Candidatus Sulfotelmatobacter sp.]